MKKYKGYVIVFFVILFFVISFVGCQVVKIGYFVNKANSNVSRAYHQSILLNNNEVLLTGGVDSPSSQRNGLASAEIYSIKHNNFKQINDMNLPHLYHKMFKMSDGNIIIADINGIEIYDNKDKTFHILNTKFENRYPEFCNYKFELLPDDKLLIIGGRYQNLLSGFGTGLINKNSGEIIDIKNDKIIKRFKILGNGFGSVLLPDGNLLILGGKNLNEQGEYLSNEIYLLDTKNYSITLWGYLPEPIVNPYVFLSVYNTVVVIGGEIFAHKEEFNGFNYIYTKGSPYIYKINLQNKNFETFDISKELQVKNTFENLIMDVIQYSDNLYWLQLRANNKFNSVLLDINSLKFQKLGNIFVVSTMRYRSSNAKTSNGILISGGKLFYQEPTEYSISSERIPYAEQAYNAESEGFLLDDTIMLKIQK